MKRIDTEGYIWDSDIMAKDYSAQQRDIYIAKSLNDIMNYLENDIKDMLKEMVEKEINNRFELLDIREKE